MSYILDTTLRLNVYDGVEDSQFCNNEAQPRFSNSTIPDVVAQRNFKCSTGCQSTAFRAFFCLSPGPTSSTTPKQAADIYRPNSS